MLQREKLLLEKVGKNDKMVSLETIGMVKKHNLWHIFAIGTNHVKVFFTENETWTEDINLRAESDDFAFVYDVLREIMHDEKIKDDLESSLLF